MEAFGAIAEATNALDQFNKEWQGKINEKAAAEVKLASDLLTAAQNELDNWHQQRTDRLSKKKGTYGCLCVLCARGSRFDGIEYVWMHFNGYIA